MKRRRLATWWVAWEDLNFPSVDNMDRIKARAEKMAQAEITTAVIFGTHFRWDYLPYFVLLHDYLATVAEELHKVGIELYDHHSVNLIHRYDTRDEMRHVMLHSGPHLPFSPSREAAETWEYKGKRLNDWRMIDVKSRKVLYYPQYAAEGFCLRNPDFIEAYQDYAKKLVKDTGVDGLMDDDPMHYMHFNSCACPHCREELKRRTGMDLPPIEDRSFWGNWENPAWKAWIDLRFDATGAFVKAVKDVLPEGFPLMSCGASSATGRVTGMASDARKFLEGNNYVNLEMSGNTPPYKHDPVTVNRTVPTNIINASHHQAAAREKGVRCYGTGYGFTEPSANIIWAVNKFLDSDCWFSTLKARLGLPDYILKTLPDEADAIGRAFRFEAGHQDLFQGKHVGQLGVYFSYETRNHTCFGTMDTGFCKDYHAALSSLFRAGISAHTVFDFPKDSKDYPLILLPSVAAMTPAEKAALDGYLKAGGKVIATGPSPLADCENSWKLPTQPDCAPIDFFSTIRDGVWHKPADWINDPIPDSGDPAAWQTPREGLFYHPHRLSDGRITGEVLELCRKFGAKLPVAVESAEGYLVTMFRDEDGITVHFLAEDYDTDIDHHLDEIRFHRSRVNYINKVTPLGVARRVRVKTNAAPEVYLPFNEEGAKAETRDGTCTVDLPENCSYFLLRFPKA